MNYSHIIDEMTWSYSRILSFEMCPYRFFLTYIKKREQEGLFFSEYGKYVHKLLSMKLSGILGQDDVYSVYVDGFKSRVVHRAPTSTIFLNYFNQGARYFRNFQFPYENPLAVEKQEDFLVEGINFTGVIDCVADSDGIILVDHKSRDLKPRSTRKTPTAKDRELDGYFRQLYLYSIIAKNLYGEYPKQLGFNCFRTSRFIVEPFQEEKLEETKKWAVKSIETIKNNENWKPSIEPFKCRNLCGFHSSECEYYCLYK